MNFSCESSDCKTLFIKMSGKAYFISQNPVVKDIEHYRNVFESPQNFIKRRVDYSRMKVFDERYRKEIERLETFKCFPPNLFHLIKALAKSGFYFFGKENDSDKVKCIYCQGILENWKKNDDPKRNHKFFFPTCPFILNINVGNESIPEKLSNYLNEDPDVKHVTEEIPYHVVRCRVDLYLFDFHEKDVEIRERSFKEFPELSQLSIYGLFVIHKNQFYYVKCCGCLKEIELLDKIETLPLDIFHEFSCSYRKEIGDVKYNVKKFPCLVEYSISNEEIEARVDFLNFSEFINKRIEIRSLIKRRLTTKGKDYKSVFELFRDLKNFKNDELEDSPVYHLEFMLFDHYCVICLDKGVEVIFLPCGHLKTCRKCSMELSSCPICRQLIERKVRGIQILR